ncbi:MAG: class I SAM-dependent methyltransferase [Clostridiaceae bacterium]|nr:class I SAM-dependent methyltransferase [Clostridiaceae bacterium]
MNDIEHNWDKMAQAYEEFTAGENSYSYKIEWPCIQKMLPDLNGKNIIDLGCGTGRFTFWLEGKSPSRITGIDLSADMIKLAQAKAKKLCSRAEFIKGDIAKHFTDEKFDFIFSSTVSHYIENLKDLFSNIYEILTPGGQCIISVMNPVYTSQYPIGNGIDTPSDDDWHIRYLDKRERCYIQPWIEYNDEVQNFLSTSFHHTFSDYVNAITACGLIITEMREPLSPEDWEKTSPRKYTAFIETPSFLIIKLQKQ